MRKGLIMLITGSLLLTGCNIANADVSSSETISDSTSYLSESYEMNTVAIENNEIGYNAETFDISKAVIPPNRDIKQCWGEKKVIPFSFNNYINILYPAFWKGSYDEKNSFEVNSIMNSEYIKAFIDGYKDYYKGSPESFFFEDALLKYAGDSLLGIEISGMGELWSFYIDSENEPHFSRDKYYKIGTYNDKSYYIFIHPFSAHLYGHGYCHPSYDVFEKEYYDKICETAYVNEIELY